MDFKTIDKSNYRECMELQVEESQKYFVADNTYPGWSMSRFMIGRQFQGNGYGKRAVREFLDYFKTKHGADRIYISVSLDNAAARKMYSDLGFREIKEIEYSYSGHLYREMQMIKHL